ncbi:uncharacterized protein LOC131857916 [Cryptomeria japonica]|uniref:uncharacterized protein LOC131857916 n=1 Tax=Cryptomeria japonica TaxID=3369 RepID=UPI0027DA3936|nr:uncharacterized protein LOC131857916 [Cryptomeria japonica]
MAAPSGIRASYESRNSESEDEYEEAGEDLEAKEVDVPEDGREERFLRVVAQASKVHKVDVSNFSRMLNPKDLIDWIEEMEDYFEFEDIKGPQRGMERSHVANEESEGGVTRTGCAPEQRESLMFRRVMMEQSSEDIGPTQRSLFRTVHKLGAFSVEKVKWEPPSKQWIKINFDGASKGNPGTSGAGVVARDDNRFILFKGAQRLQDGTNNEAEIQAAFLATKLPSNMKVQRLHLEGDSQIVVNAIARGNTPCWKLNRWVAMIREKLNTFVEFCVTHIRRGANALAVMLSNIGSELDNCATKWWKGDGRVWEWY